MPPPSRWRALAAADLPEVMRIAAAAHPDLPERAEVFAQKRALFPAGCFALERAGRLAGYAFSHPWTIGAVPPLDSFLGALPAEPDCLYLHDAALLAEARGAGAGRRLVALLRDVAAGAGLRRLALASVYDTAPLWARLGFAENGEAEPAKLRAYGPTARYMTRSV